MQVIAQDQSTKTATIQISLDYLDVFQNITPADIDELAFNQAARSPKTLQHCFELSEMINQKFS